MTGEKQLVVRFEGHMCELQLNTGADLEKQFRSDYIPRVFCTTFPHVVGGPDFPGQERWRRKGDAEPVPLDLYTTMMASRCEYQIRTDWDLQPGLFSLAFASRVNLGQSMAIRRALRRGAGEEDTDASRAQLRTWLPPLGELLRIAEYETASHQVTISLGH